MALLCDKDPGVRRTTTFGLARFNLDMEPYIPVFREMLKDKDPGIQTAALEMLERLRVPVPVKDLGPLFKIPDRVTIGLVRQMLSRQTVSNQDLVRLLQDPEPLTRMIALRILFNNADKQSVELALPLLKDADPMVRMHAAATLRALTGQHSPKPRPTCGKNGGRNIKPILSWNCTPKNFDQNTREQMMLVFDQPSAGKCSMIPVTA